MAADESSYQETIAQLNQFKNRIMEGCRVLQTAGRDCVDNTDNDPAAVTSNEKLSECINKIQGTLPQIDSIIWALNEEMEAIKEAAARANS